MSKLNYVNLGCGKHIHPDWINIDFVSFSKEVIAHNLLNGVPLESSSMDVVYHSHVLEHFPKDKAFEFMGECFRVLKPGGILRIAIPDLEQIISNYVRISLALKENPTDEKLWSDYDWIVMELYDQTVRNASGGEMTKLLTSGKILNKDFILQRCGEEVKNILDFPEQFAPVKSENRDQRLSVMKELYRLLRYGKRKERLIRLLLGREYGLLKIGRFRTGGEIHQWMYDRLSLGRLLKEVGFEQVEIKGAFESSIANWSKYNLDGKDGVVRKPDSLFVEAKKPLA